MKKIKALIVILLVAIFAVACSDSEESNGKDSEGKEMTLRLGSHLAPSHSVIAITEMFKEIVEEESEGRIKVEIHPSGELGGQSELVQALQIGSIEMTINDAGVLSNYAKKVGLLDLPYMFEDYDHVHKVLDSEVGDELAASLEEVGIVSLGWVDSAFRDLIVNEKVETVDDVNGLQIRVPDAPQYLETVSAWGATASSIPWGDIYTSLETGVVDGFEGSAESIHSAGLQEVSKYRVQTEHIFTALSLNISKQVFDGLSKEDQELLKKAGEEAALWGREVAMERDDEYKQKLAEEGLEPVEVDKEQFRAATIDFVNEYAEEVDGVEIVEKINELR